MVHERSRLHGKRELGGEKDLFLSFPDSLLMRENVISSSTLFLSNSRYNGQGGLFGVFCPPFDIASRFSASVYHIDRQLYICV